MRDSRRIQERMELRLDRLQVIWLTLGVIVAMGLTFSTGFVIGRRATLFEDNAIQMDDPIAQLADNAAQHEKLTFYKKLTEERTQNSKKAHESSSTEIAPNSKQDKHPPVIKMTQQAINVPEAIREALQQGPAQKGEYCIQVSAFQSRPEAQAFVAGLERKGFKPYIVSAQLQNKGTWYRVRLGRFANQDRAQQARSFLIQSDIPAWVLQNE